LLSLVHFQGVVLTDLLTFGAALGTLWIVRIPKAPPSAEGLASRGSLLSEAAFGWRYLRVRPALMELLLFQAAVNFLLGFIMILGAPMALHFMSEAKLGALLSLGGLGMLLGSLLMAAWGGPKRLILGMLGGQLICGLAALGGGLRPSAILFSACLFVFMFATPLSGACAQAIWQRKIPADIQGKVFSTRRIVGWIGAPVAYLAAGPLADLLLEPLMAPGGALAPSVGRFIGSGSGRGIALLFMAAGALMIVTVVWAAATRLRSLEEDLSDGLTLIENS